MAVAVAKEESVAPRAPPANKYRRVQKKQPSAKEEGKSVDGEMLISGYGRTQNYIAYAAKVFNDEKKRELVIKATGMAMPTAVATVEVIKRRIKGLSQVTKLGSYEVEDEYEPIEDGLEPMTRKRQVTYMVIYLSLDKLDEDEPGFQAPLADDLVLEVEDMKVGPVNPNRAAKEDGEDSKPTRRSKKGKGKKGRGKGDKKDDSKKEEGKGKKKEGDAEEGGEKKSRRSRKGRKGRGKGSKNKEESKEEEKKDDE